MAKRFGDTLLFTNSDILYKHENNALHYCYQEAGQDTGALEKLTHFIYLCKALYNLHSHSTIRNL